MKKERIQYISFLEPNFKILLSDIKRKYPQAFNEFNTFNFSEESYPDCFWEFLNSYKLKVSYKLTDPINLNFNGTYSYKIEMAINVSCKLNRRSNTYSYYGIKSKNSAIEKAVNKGFQIVNCLLTNQELPQQKRVR